MPFCNKEAITDAAFVHLAGIYTLVLNICRQPTITGAGLVHLAGVRRLSMLGCAPELVAAALDQGLPATDTWEGSFNSFSCTVGGELWSA
jgi:hypothetical protein